MKILNNRRRATSYRPIKDLPSERAASVRRPYSKSRAIHNPRPKVSFVWSHPVLRTARMKLAAWRIMVAAADNQVLGTSAAG